jgi:tetratricopeptide repeat protein 21B
LQFFEIVLNEEDGGNHRQLEAMLGRAKFYEKVKKYDVALEILSEVSIAFKSFNPSLIEKSKIHIFNGDWEQALETIQKVMIEERQNVEALRIYIFYLLSRETDIDFVLEKMTDLMEAMRVMEPKNGELYYNLARLFARFCGRKEIVLKKTMQMLELAVGLQPENS